MAIFLLTSSCILHFNTVKILYGQHPNDTFGLGIMELNRILTLPPPKNREEYIILVTMLCSLHSMAMHMCGSLPHNFGANMGLKRYNDKPKHTTRYGIHMCKVTFTKTTHPRHGSPSTRFGLRIVSL